MRKKIWFIINPVSGGYSKKIVAAMINEFFGESKYDLRICETAYAGHGAVLATMASENNVDTVVAIGGDGTINEVARSLVHTDTSLGIVPCGSGNGLARHLRIPLDFSEAMRLIKNGNVVSLDYGLVNNRPFFCTCGMGYDAAVSYKFSSSTKRGLKSYIENTLVGLAKYKPEAYTVVDKKGRMTYKAFCIALANASQYGNNAYIAPEASMTDGLMDVTVIEPFPLIEAGEMAYMLFTGKFKEGVKHIKTFRSDSLTIVRQHPGVIHCDGDPMKAQSVIEVKIVPSGLKVITNSDASAHIEPLIRTIGEQVMPLVAVPAAALKLAGQTIVGLFKPKDN